MTSRPFIRVNPNVHVFRSGRSCPFGYTLSDALFGERGGYVVPHRSGEVRVAQTTLAEVLKDRLAWQVYNFGWAGPRRPYARLGMRLLWNPIRLEPCFESFSPDRFIFRSSTLVREVMAPFRWLLAEDAAFDESFPRGFVQQLGFPTGQWLRLLNVQLHYVHLLSADGSAHLLPSNALCAATCIHLGMAAGVDD